MSSPILNADLISVMSPSIQKVYAILKPGKKLRVSEIERKTNYSPRTVRQALVRLQMVNLVTQIPDMYDMRSHFYMALS